MNNLMDTGNHLAPYTSPFEYTREEWVKHFDHFLPTGSSREQVTIYFLTEYELNRKEGYWKMRRFWTALGYLLKHLNDFEKFIVVHERSALISAPIVRGLWHYYSAIPNENLASEPPHVLILAAAEMECATNL